MRDIARRRREAEEKLALHLFATEPQLRCPDPPDEAATASPVLPGLVTPARASEQHIHEPHDPDGPEVQKAPPEQTRTP